ncbi:MAG TPA: hypothetical protein VFP65_11020 [Anaeromyxobacteraceae bacterium]|nr:hypothetical protein [Anaeromyxobacteraceae bacterium]
MLGAGVLQHDRAVALGQQLADLVVYLGRRQLRGVELGALVEIDVERARIGEILLGIGLEEALLGAARETLGVHSHVMRFGAKRHGRFRSL